jgi:TetR/AcrR family transcriptional repressor of nem operon
MRKKAENPVAKQKLLDAAESLMLQKGFSATSIDEMCQKAKLTKGTFFHYFKSKEDLGKVVLDRFCCSSHNKMVNGCGCYDHKDPLKRIDGYLDYLGQMIKEDGGRGCLLANFAMELSDTSPVIRQACEAGFNQWAKTFKKDLKEVNQKYAPRSDVNIDSLADHLLAIVEGSQILGKAKKDRNLMARNLEHFKTYIHSIFRS